MHGFAWAWAAGWFWGWLIVAVALAPVVGGILKARRYEMEEAQHVAGPPGLPNPLEPIGSMILAEEHPLEPLPAPTVDAHPWEPDWREQTLAELSPERLSGVGVDDIPFGEWFFTPPLDPGPGGAALNDPPASPGPAECSPWLAEQLDVLRAWSEWQQQKMAVLA